MALCGVSLRLAAKKVRFIRVTATWPPATRCGPCVRPAWSGSHATSSSGSAWRPCRRVAEWRRGVRSLPAPRPARAHRVVPAGSRWDMWRILHQVRTVDQVRVRIGSVRARAFWELERGLRRLDFAPFLPNSNGVIRTVRGTLHVLPFSAGKGPNCPEITARDGGACAECCELRPLPHRRCFRARAPPFKVPFAAARRARRRSGRARPWRAGHVHSQHRCVRARAAAPARRQGPRGHRPVEGNACCRRFKRRVRGRGPVGWRGGVCW